MIRHVHAIVIGIFVIFLPVLNQADYCFAGISVKMILFVLSAIVLISAMSVSKEFKYDMIDISLLLFGGWGVLRYFTSDIPTDIFTLYGMLSVLMVYVWIRCIGDCHIVFTALFIGGILQAIWGILQLLGVLDAGHLYFRETGSFDNPALWGIYLGISFYSGTVLLDRKNVNYNKWMICVGMLLILVGLVFARSRTVWVALACGLIWIYGAPYYWTRLGHRKMKMKILVIGILVLCLLLLVMWGIYQICPESVQGRLLIFRVAFDMFWDAPYWGHGISSFCAKYMLYQAAWFDKYPDSGWIMVAGNSHLAFNEYLKMLCEQGIVGLMLFGWVIYKVVRKGSFENARIYTGMLIILLVAGVFSYPFEDMAILVVFGICLAEINNKTIDSYRVCFVSNVWKYVVVAILVVGIGMVTLSYGYRKWVEDDLRSVKEGSMSVLDILAFKDFGQLDSSKEYVLWVAEELYRNSHYRDAIPVLEQAVKLHCNELVLNALGVCYQNEGMYIHAENAFKLASYMTPAYILPQYYLFTLYREIGDKEAACRVAEKALEMQVKITNTTVLRARDAMRTYIRQNRKGGE